MHSFKTVSDIRIEPGGTAKLDAHVAGLPRNKRIAIITDKGVRSLGLMDAGVAALEDAGVKTVRSLADIGIGLKEVTGW